MFVEQGARATLLAREKNQFINVELPQLRQRMKNLGFTKDELISLMNSCDADEEVKNKNEDESDE